MANLIAGVGPGLFALIFVTVLAIIVGLIMAFIKPDKAVPIFIGALLLPLLVFGLIMAAPTEEQTSDVVIDHHYIGRVIFFIMMSLGAVVGPGYYIGVCVLGHAGRGIIPES